jgi:hypothetical protein
MIRRPALIAEAVGPRRSGPPVALMLLAYGDLGAVLRITAFDVLIYANTDSYRFASGHTPHLPSDFSMSASRDLAGRDENRDDPGAWLHRRAGAARRTVQGHAGCS